jgi:hypothetical protein
MARKLLSVTVLALLVAAAFAQVRCAGPVHEACGSAGLWDKQQQR